MSDENKITVRQAPEWAWEIIEETLAMDSQSKAFDQSLRDDIRKALNAMIFATENWGMDRLSEEDTPDDDY